MWKHTLVVVTLLSSRVNGQVQFHRQVRNPTGPSQIILRGGALNGNDHGDESGIPLQSYQEPAPDVVSHGGGAEFGIPLGQSSPGDQIQRQAPQVLPTTVTTAIPSFGIPQYVVQQELEASVIDQPAPIVRQTEITLPYLPAGQQYVDVYGRPIILEQPPTTTTTTTTPAPTPPVTKQALVDNYGRKLAEIHLQQQLVPVTQPLLQTAAIPAVPVVQDVVQPAAVAVPVAAKKLAVLSDAPTSGLTLHTYAVPAVRKVGNLVIPYAKKVLVASPPGAAIPVPAFVKSEALISPIKVTQPVAEAAHVLSPIAQEIHHVQAAVPVANHVEASALSPVAVHHPTHVLAHPHLSVEHHLASPAVVHHPVAPVVPIVEKTIVPEVTLIQQPVLSKVQFQRHIFNVKHGSDPVVHQDICTVYPYQKNLRACVLKKAVLPELHHPDVRTIHVEEFPHQADQTIIAGGSPIFVPPPPTSSPSVTVTKSLPKNIADTIRRESARSKANAQVTAAAKSARRKTTVQPEAAESNQSVTTRKSRRRNSKSSRRTTEKPFQLA